MATEAPAAGLSTPVADSGSAVDVSASAVPGAAPGVGDAAAQTGAPADAAASPASAGFRFAGRQFNDQKHAEQAIQAELGRIRGTQRDKTRLETELAEVRRKLEVLSVLQPGQGP